MTEAYPLSWPAGWPRTASSAQERGNQFKQNHWQTGRSLATFAVARDKLYLELERLGAQQVVVSTNHKPDRSGLPIESKRKVADDGVAIYFQLKGRSMAMACDRFDNAAANMRSLGLAIDAMRQLERHGGGQMMERAFAGFAALPAPVAKRKWWDVLETLPDSAPEIIEWNYKRLAKDRHPDNGGDANAMAELNAARADARAARTLGAA